MLHIVKQEYKEELVDAKPVSYFPKTDATGDVVGFGKLNATYIRVLFNYDKCLYPQTSWKLTMNASTGKMNLTPPKKYVPATLASPATFVDADYNGSAKKSSGQKTSEEMAQELKRQGFPDDFCIRLFQTVQDGLAAFQAEMAEVNTKAAEKKRIKAEKASKKAARKAA